MPTPSIYILGGHQTDFSQHYQRAGLGMAELLSETIEGCLANAQIDAESIDSAQVGNFVGGMFCGQNHLGGLVAEVCAGLRNKPISRHEAACASGSMAVMAAVAEIAAGFSDTALVAGVEMMRNVPGGDAAGYLATAAWHGQESLDTKLVWPAQFSQLLDEYDNRYGVNHAHLHAISQSNFSNAQNNPLAQSRNWPLDPLKFCNDDELNPVVQGRIRRTDCSQITDGGAAIVLASEAKAAEYATKRGLTLDQIPKLKGWSYRTTRLPLQPKLDESASQPLIFPHVAQVAAEARSRAGFGDVFDLDGIETHDCFSISHYMAIDHLGITAPGESWKAVEDGTVFMGGKLPMNASGGLIGVGHPVGATGVRMLLDACKQVTGQAGDMQIAGAKNIGTLNIGGSTTTAASFVVGVK